MALITVGVTGYDFPLLSNECQRTGPFWDVTVATSRSGKEMRATWQSAGRYRWRLRFDGLRQSPHSPDELANLMAIVSAAKGTYGTMTLVDPVDGVSRLVRIASDEVEVSRIVDKIWETQTLELVSVL